jgi:hypothetical protein
MRARCLIPNGADRRSLGTGEGPVGANPDSTLARGHKVARHPQRAAFEVPILAASAGMGR